jgi:hypothetical protein
MIMKNRITSIALASIAARASIATLALSLLAVPTLAAASSKAAGCDKACLLHVLNAYQAKMLKHDIRGIAVSEDFRSVENYRPIALGEGYWTRISEFLDQVQLADPVNGQVAAVGSLVDGGRDAYFVLRLKVEAGRKISQSEMMLIHDGETSFLQKDRSVKLDRSYLQRVPVAQRSSRADLAKIVDGFVDAWQYKDEDLMSVSADCAFLENNVQLQQPGITTCGDMLEYMGKRGIPGQGKGPNRGDPNKPPRPSRPADPSIGRPALQGSQPWMRDRRTPLVDAEHGVVLAYHIQGGEPARPGEVVAYERATPFTTSSLSSRRSPEQNAQRQGSRSPGQNNGPPPGSGAAYMAGLFKIIDGRLVRIDHFEWEGGPNASGGFSDGPPLTLLNSAQAQLDPAPAAAPDQPAAPKRPSRPPNPVFDNSNTDPRDFEGLWLPGRARVAGAPEPARGAQPAGGLSGPILGGPAANETSGSTLQCTPVWRLIGAGGGMSNYWIMGEKEIVLLSEEDMDVVHKIYVDGKHPKKLTPQPNGHSVGHWEGNVLVVDTVGFAKADGSLADRHVLERFEKTSGEKTGGVLIDHATVTEGGKTVELELPSHWRPDLSISENVCEEGFRRYGLKDGQVVNFNTLPE